MSSYSSPETEIMAIMGIAMSITFSVVFVLMLVLFLFEAIGLYQISKKRGYQKPWLAFIPIASGWILGSVADNIDYCYGKQSRFRIWLVIAEGVWAGFFVAYMVGMMNFMQQMFFQAIYENNHLSDSSLAALGLFPFLACIVSLISIGRLVLRYIALYKLYQDYDKKNTVLYLVLSILFGIGCFFIFACRNKPSASLYWSYTQQNPGYRPQNNNPPYGGAGSYGNAPYGGAPQSGAPQNGAPKNGTPQNGAPQSGAPQNGAPQSGAPQNVAPPSGVPKNGVPQNGTPQSGQPYTGNPNDKPGV